MGIAGEKEIWTSALSLISSRKGNHVSHNLLLCSFFIGFGLNAFVALGVKQNKPWSWVVTLDDEIHFWDGVTGQRYTHVAIDPDNMDVPATFPTITHPYKIIDCMFNHENVYGNIQLENRVPLVCFELKNPRKWKSMDASAVSALHYSRPFVHSPRTIKISQCTDNLIHQAQLIERNVEITTISVT